jgi:hypothetical protein
VSISLEPHDRYAFEAGASRFLIGLVTGRHVCSTRERLDVQRLCVFAVDPITNAPQHSEVAQLLHFR